MASRPLVVLDALLVTREPTGVGRSILELCRALSQQDRGLAFTVLVTCPSMFEFLRDVPHWRVQNCPGAGSGALAKAVFTQFRLPGLVRRVGGEILHSLQFVGPVLPPCPTVVTVHDLGFLRFPGTVEQPRRAYYRALVRRTLRNSARIVTNSAATAADVALFFPEVSDRISVTPFGTPTWVRGRSVPAGGRPADAPFVFVGTLEPRKNLERLLRAYARFLARCRERTPAGPVPDLVLVGARGWSDAGLQATIRSFPAPDRLRLEGYCGPDRLWEIYGSARALLFPSLHEGFGFPILEAMVADLPVLTADRGAMREVAGQAALLVDPEDTAAIAAGLEELFYNGETRAQLAARGRRRWPEWTWERAAAATEAVYRGLLTSGG